MKYLSNSKISTCLAMERISVIKILKTNLERKVKKIGFKGNSMAQYIQFAPQEHLTKVRNLGSP